LLDCTGCGEEEKVAQEATAPAANTATAPTFTLREIMTIGTPSFTFSV
jgi:hypothetical protein